jgi:uncharacterized membrane protein (Fun14 family)
VEIPNMLRTILLILALAVLILIGLVWMGVISFNQQADGDLEIRANPVEVTPPTVKAVPANGQ